MPPQLLLARIVMILLPLVALASALLFMVSGYVLTSSSLEVRRPFWNTSIPLRDLVSVSGDSEALTGSMRLFGNMYAGELIFLLIACFTLGAALNHASTYLLGAGQLRERRHRCRPAATGSCGRDVRHGGGGRHCRPRVSTGALRPHPRLHVY